MFVFKLSEKAGESIGHLCFVFAAQGKGGGREGVGEGKKGLNLIVSVAPFSLFGRGGR